MCRKDDFNDCDVLHSCDDVFHSHPADKQDLEVTNTTVMSPREETFLLEWPRDVSRALLLDLFCLDF